MRHTCRRRRGRAVSALTEGRTNTRRQRRGEKWRRWRRWRWRGWRWRPKWRGPGPTEQAGIIRAGKWAESHAVLSNRPGATDDKPDGWQCTVSTLLRERGRTVERERRELQVVRAVARHQERENEGAGGQSGNVLVNEHWEQMFTPGTRVTCLRWSHTDISEKQSCFGNYGDLTGGVKPQQQLPTSESNYSRARKWPQNNIHSCTWDWQSGRRCNFIYRSKWLQHQCGELQRANVNTTSLAPSKEVKTPWWLSAHLPRSAAGQWLKASHQVNWWTTWHFQSPEELWTLLSRLDCIKESEPGLDWVPAWSAPCGLVAGRSAARRNKHGGKQ